MDERFKTPFWKNELRVYPVWTGTFVAYTTPDTTFKQSIKRGDGGYLTCPDAIANVSYLFKVPAQFQDKKNAILVVEHGFTNNDGAYTPTITMNEDKGRYIVEIANEGLINILEGFPAEGNDHKHTPYLPNTTFAIPLGAKVESNNPLARDLIRVPSYIGFLARVLPYPLKSVKPSDLYAVVAGHPQSMRYGALVIEQSDLETAQTTDLQEIIKKAKEAAEKLSFLVNKIHLNPITNLIRAANSDPSTVPAINLQKIVTAAETTIGRIKLRVSNEVLDPLIDLVCTLTE